MVAIESILIHTHPEMTWLIVAKSKAREKITKNLRQVHEFESTSLAGSGTICFMSDLRGVPFRWMRCEGDGFFSR